MSNVIQFLEKMGGSYPMYRAEDYEELVNALEVDDSERQALLRRDRDSLSELLGGRELMVCALYPAEEQPSHEEGAEEGESEKEDEQDPASPD